MANLEKKDVLISENNNRTQENESLDKNNEEEKKTENEVQYRKQRKKKKKKLKQPSDDEKDTYYNTTTQNQGDTELKDIKRPRPLPDVPSSTKREPENSTPRRPLPDVPSGTKREPENSTPRQHNNLEKKSSLENAASSVMLGFKGLIMAAALVLISSSVEVSTVGSCDLAKALKSISLNYTVTCKYDDIKEDFTTLSTLGIISLTTNFIFFLLILFFLLLPRIGKLILFICLPCFAILSGFMITEYKYIINSKTTQNDMNYDQLQSAMAIWLKQHFTSDNISSSDVISNSWNKFFIEYNCCAINQVLGTTNDFDSTPWCTTSGSCQATASQIPKTCCNYLSEDDYESATSACHSSVNPGTFRSNCMGVIKKLSVANVEECQLSMLQMSLIIIGTLELVSTTFEIMAVIIWKAL